MKNLLNSYKAVHFHVLSILFSCVLRRAIVCGYIVTDGHEFVCYTCLISVINSTNVQKITSVRIIHTEGCAFIRKHNFTHHDKKNSFIPSAVGL